MQDAAIAIQAHGLGKTYRLWATPSSRLSAPLLARLSRLPMPASWRSGLQQAVARRVANHVALDGVSFTLRRGEALGVIGANGSGKSTLLQLLAGVLPATAGKVTVLGRVAALLELGSGFNPEMTGRENVRINAAILGFSRAQIDARLDEIIAFADIGQFIDQPVKTYSSGMSVRLAFAVQVHIEPDVLIVDEALAVGDAAFQAKAMAKVEQILRDGATLLFVGHDLSVVKAFCDRAILLEQGVVAMLGSPEEVITEYLHRSHMKTLAAIGDRLRGELQRRPDGFGLEDAGVVRGTLNGASHVTARYGDDLSLSLEVRLRPDIAHPLLIVDVMDGRGMQLSGRRVPLPPVDRVSEVRVDVDFPATLQKGVYAFRLRLLDSAELSQHLVLARQEGRPSFEVVDDSRERFTGLFPLPMDVRVSR